MLKKGIELNDEFLLKGTIKNAVAQYLLQLTMLQTTKSRSFWRLLPRKRIFDIQLMFGCFPILYIRKIELWKFHILIKLLKGIFKGKKSALQDLWSNRRNFISSREQTERLGSKTLKRQQFRPGYQPILFNNLLKIKHLSKQRRYHIYCSLTSTTF